MRRFSITCISLLVSLTLFLSSYLSSVPVLALSPTPTGVEYALPYPGILPDHPLYIFKTWRDKILIFVTQDPLKKSQLYLLFADKYIGMGELLLARKQYALAGDTFLTGEKYLLTAIGGLGSRKNVDKLPPGVADKIESASKKHEEILKKLQQDGESEVSKEKIQDALSMNHQAIQQIPPLK